MTLKENDFWKQSGQKEKMPVNYFPNKPLLLHVCSTSLLENSVGNGEIARTLSENFPPFSSN